MGHGELLFVRDIHMPRWRHGVVDRLVAAGLDPGRRDAAELAVHEAVCNALEHGHRGDTSLGIELRLTRERVDRLVVHVVDRALGGRWSPPCADEVGERSPTPPVGQRGHGLALMRAGCDELRINTEPGVTHVSMTFASTRHPARAVGANALERYVRRRAHVSEP